MIPPAWLPPIPNAWTSCARSSPWSFPAAAAAPKVPATAVGWKWRAWSAPGTARPTRHITSTPAIRASSTARPEAPAASPTASAVVTATQPVWTIASSRVSSKSSPWASVALARTALAAATRPAGRGADERALRGAPQPLRDAEHRAPELLAGGGERVAHHVEGEVRRLRHDRRGHLVQVEAGDEPRQAPGGSVFHGSVNSTTTYQSANHQPLGCHIAA